MKRLATLAVLPLFAGFLCAQTQSTETTDTVTTYNGAGTLIDAGCRTVHAEHSRTETSNPDINTTQTKTTKTKTDSTECPVTAQTTSFGMLTSDGQFVRFDEPSNTRIVEMVKTNRDWGQDLNDRKPIRVKVVGKHHGDVVVVESIK